MAATEIDNDKSTVGHQEEPAPLKIGNEKAADDNAAALEGQDLDFTEEENKRILRKIDLRILPLAAIACGLQYVDKAGLGAASIYGLIEDLNLEGQEYSWAASIFYFGNLLGSIFAGRVLQYFHVGKTLGVAFFAWGITLLGCIGAKNFATLAAMRFLLGLLESVLVPGLLFITTMWYTHREQPARLGLWTFMNGLLPIPFILVFWALGNVTSGPLKPWQLIFLLLGLISCGYGVILWFFLPDSPTSVKWLTPREKAVAVERIAREQTGIKNKEFKWGQAREAFKDIHVYLIFAAMFFAQVSGSVQTNFLGLIIRGFGYGPLTTQLLTIPNYAVQTVVVLCVSFPPTFIKSCRNMKIPITVCATIVAVIGVILLYVTPPEIQYQSRRLASVIILSFATANYNVIMSVIGANIGGFTKKQVTTSVTFFFYCLINIICPQTFLKSEAPRYPTGMKFVIA
ncbi:MFS general substrate transporter [Sarocladium strictum]